MRDLDVIDSELRVVAAVRRILTELGEPLPRITTMDELLDERCAVSAHSSQPTIDVVAQPEPGRWSTLTNYWDGQAIQ
ncbi:MULTISPECIES: hypothetical protein [Mycobacterium]|uniref:Uncharacterized protein n=2 Tax=Mycobacterium TaxID=1763 RepID=A0AAW5S5R7_MYCBC|nr:MULTISPECIES: hypothetical protein [Mycobacterium]EUA17556.1 hypothetical protein I553_10614 [Mycobacterium xenopi 4042]MCV6990824.1 hypothetical protein [Mycobacterium bouchedurhonense]MCV6995990.1 hypothetical protein [Mycobacterium timonense]MDA3641985.1 hypothetical protein [Mycobacterium xenopi]MDA3660195.1 hypothetical protein [Mycobacterium xenopi]